ncbi:MAG: hypothetical protein Q6373_025835 [Candidatus Sigynarchaeota archaeon]
MKLVKNQLARLLEAAKVSSDDFFKGRLEAGKHELTVQASEAFRTMFRALDPFRFGLSCGHFHRDGMACAFWFLNDYGARGTPDDVMDRITGSLAGVGFSISKAASDENGVILDRIRGTLKEAFTIEPVARFTGTKEHRAGGHLLHEITLQEKCAPLTVGEVIDSWPALECFDLPSPFKEYLYPLPAIEVSKGGTWTQYYDWTARIAAENQQVEQLFGELKRLTEKNGFVLESDNEGTLTYFHGKRDPPVVFLSIEPSGRGMQFRIQPRM